MTNNKGQSMMILDRIGDWNPQLFRELKGRMKGRNMAIAMAVSLLGQAIVAIGMQIKLPKPKPPDAAPNWGTDSIYCTGNYRGGDYDCLPDGLGYWQINWQSFWFDMAMWSSVVMLLMLILGGVYLLISDLANEQKRGTLNFIRLTPQSSESILLGKILGVPALVYIAVALVLPLQIGSAIAAGVPIDTLVRFYLLAAAGCGLFYTTALLLGFLGATAGLGFIVAGLLSFPYIGLFRLMFPKRDLSYWQWTELQWFSLPLGENLDLLQLFAFGNFLLWTFWLWQVVNRRFRNPSTTILSKRQSYYIMPCWQVLLLGITSIHKNDNFWDVIAVYSISNLLTFIVLIAALSQQRQTLQNWARYKHLEGQHYSAMREWIWGDKSPALVAIAIHLAITAMIWMPGLLLQSFNNKAVVIISLLASANLIFIYAAIAQLILFLKTKKNIEWAVGMVLWAIALPPILLVFLDVNLQNSGWWLFSVFSVGVFQANSISFSISGILLSFLGQICVMSALSWQLNRVLKKAGDSESKILLEERRSLTS
jgi:hypothetical protein